MASVKTVCGLALASVKTVDGLAASSLKTVMGVDAVVSGGYTLLYNSITSGTDQWPFTYLATNERFYAGGLYFTDASARTIGKITIKMVKAAGSITGKTYTVRLWTLTGSALNSNVASSDGVTGSDSWSATEVDFIFSTPYTTTGSTNYGITIDAGTSDASNYAAAYNKTPQNIPGDLAWWSSSKSLDTSFNTYNLQMKIYTTP